MKTFGTIVALLVLVLVALGLRAVNQTHEKSRAALALKMAEDEMAQQRQRAQAAEAALRIPEVEQPLPPAVVEAPAPRATPLIAVGGPPSSDPLAEALVGFDAATFFSGTGPATPQDLSRASLQVLQTAQGYESYISNHSALASRLNALATLSQAILQDDGADPAKSEQGQRALSVLVDNVISLADAIAKRPTGATPRPGSMETPEAVQQTQQLTQMLTVIKARQGL